ncbi:MAG: gamma-glutamyl-gamma-aminobutyrate hydrolase family protein [Burkholderiales bacterium]|nr:gamma-glutamyl-gamma-aminobutyrate hydrolase family protein [Phycisphaerae bacterium]
MTRPRIGITVDYVDAKPHYMLPWTYAESIEKAGGLPVMLPFRVDTSLIPAYLDELDGMLLSGGDDLDPALYGEPWHPQAQHLDPNRQRFELALLAEIERRDMPVLGICLGSQTMNVSRGGSMIQFIPDHLGAGSFEHRLSGDWLRRHGVKLLAESLYAQALGKTDVQVNTSHKQAVNVVGRGLRVIAVSMDGLIEGTEDPSRRFYMGVQWHPERQNDEPDHLKLFQMLVDHAR